MTVEDPRGPLILCRDGSAAAERAIRIAPVLVGPGRAARPVRLQADRAVAGGRSGDDRQRIDAPVHGEADGYDIVDRGVAVARDAGFDAEALLLVADRRTAEIIAETAEELDAPAIVMGQRGMSGLKSAVLGSVSREVVNAYHRPVVIV
jgi:nucleotide-binding universal stress UspA family protein